jgi:O-antigen/teichoic acid export membrane protein
MRFRAALSQPVRQDAAVSGPVASPVPPSLRARLTYGVAWNFLGVVFNQGSTFLVNVLLAHILGLKVFGEYAMVQSTMGAAALLAQMATGYTATKYVAELRSTDPARAGRVIGLLGLAAVGTATLTALILLVSSPWLAADLLRHETLTPALAVASGAVFFMATSGFLMGALAGLEEYRTLGLAGVASGIIYVAMCVAGARVAGLAGAVTGVALSGAVQSVILWQAVRLQARRHGIQIRLHHLETEAAIIVRFAIPAALSGFIAMPALWVSNAFLARQDGGFALLALFSASNSFRIIVLFLPNIVNNVSMSLLNHQWGLRDDRSYRRVFWANLAVMLTIVCLGAATVAILGRWLLLWFGPEFSKGYTVLIILMAVTIFESAATALYQVIQSRGRIWWSVAAVTIPGYGTLTVLAWYLTPAYGAIGLAWAHLGGWIVALAACGAIASKLGVQVSGTTPAAEA